MGILSVALAVAQVSMPAKSPSDTTWVDRAVVVVAVDGAGRELQWELVVPAPVDAVWAAWTNPDEIATWAGPAAKVDLVPGGKWHVIFKPDTPEGEQGSDANTILAIDAPKSIRFRAGAPVEFPNVRREKTEFSIQLTPVGFGHTLVSARQTGFKAGDEWDRAFSQMADMNAEWLNWLHRRFVEGPIDWSQIDFKAMGGKG